MKADPRIALGLAAVAAGVGLWIALAGGGSKVVPPPPSSAPPPFAPAPASDTAAPGAPLAAEITSVAGDDAFTLEVLTIALAGARLSILDMGMGSDLKGALGSTGASLVVNAGFFDEARRAEGLSISEGRELSPKSDGLGGGIVEITGGRATLHAAEGWPPPGDGDVRRVDFAIQARPRLVIEGKSNIGKDDGKEAERTALCLRDDGRTLEVVVARGERRGAGPTLALLADMLVSRGCQGALNLDGGPSTGLAYRRDAGVREMPPRGPIRQAIAVWARP